MAISHRIDVKSYTSLHTLVNDMFPPTSLVEQVRSDLTIYILEALECKIGSFTSKVLLRLVFPSSAGGL